jgi:hypothetical protein
VLPGGKRSPVALLEGPFSSSRELGQKKFQRPLKPPTLKRKKKKDMT